MVGDDEEDGMFKITTRISWANRGARPYEEVVTYLYFPPDEDDL